MFIGPVVAAPAAEMQMPQASAAAQSKARVLAAKTNRDFKIAQDLDKVVATPMASDMTIAEQKAVTELAQKALAVRNALEYRQQLRERIAEVREELAENPDDAALKAELAELEKKLAAASDMTQLAQLELQDAMQRQQQTFRTLSNILKQQHETTKAIIQNIKG